MCALFILYLLMCAVFNVTNLYEPITNTLSHNLQTENISLRFLLQRFGISIKNRLQVLQIIVFGSQQLLHNRKPWIFLHICICNNYLMITTLKQKKVTSICQNLLKYTVLNIDTCKSCIVPSPIHINSLVFYVVWN